MGKKLPILMVWIWLSLLGIAGVSSAAETQITFRNSTNATMKISLITNEGIQVGPQVIASPDSEISIAVQAGKQLFDLIAYRADPVRIHRTGMMAQYGKANNYHIIPHIFGLYILDDSDSILAIPSISSEAPKFRDSKFDPEQVKQKCLSSGHSGTGFAIWEDEPSETVQHYLDSGKFLCASDGTHIFEQGEIYKFFRCRGAWRDCYRMPAKDGMPEPTIRTSSIADRALHVAQQYDPEAFHTSTQVFNWVDGGENANLTTYRVHPIINRSKRCSAGYRLHYQGQCINIEDELEDDPDKGVRMVEPQILD